MSLPKSIGISFIQHKLFPVFPSIQDSPPSLQEIQAADPRWAVKFWEVCSMMTFFSMIAVAIMGATKVCNPILLALLFWALMILLFFSINILIYYHHGQIEKFEAIDGKSSSSWTCTKVMGFFERNPSLAYYREEVIRQGRPLYVGEMDALLIKREELLKADDCRKLYALN